MNKNTRRNKAKRGKISTDNQQIISQNLERNMQMRVLWNKGKGAVGNCSLTVHEPIDKNKPFKPYKKKAYKYGYVKGLNSVSVGGEEK